MALVDACGISHTICLIIHHHLWVLVNILVWASCGCARLILDHRTNAEAVVTVIVVLRVNVAAVEVKVVTVVGIRGVERTRPIVAV